MKNQRLRIIISIFFLVLISACAIGKEIISIKSEPTSNQEDILPEQESTQKPQNSLQGNQGLEVTEQIGNELNNVNDPQFIEKDIYEIGDFIKVGDDIILVLGWEEYAVDSKYYMDSKYIGIDIIVVNNSEKSKNYNLTLRKLFDTNDNSYDELNSTPVYIEKTIDLNGEIYILPGDKIRGTLVYELPLESNPDYFVWHCWINSEDVSVKIRLGADPIKIKVPDLIPGEIEPHFNFFGDEVQYNDQSIALKEVIIDKLGDWYKPERGFKFVYIAVGTSKIYKDYIRTYIRDNSGRYISENAYEAVPYKTDCSSDNFYCSYHGYEIPDEINEFIIVLDPAPGSVSNPYYLFKADGDQYFNESNTINGNIHYHALIQMEDNHGNFQIRETIDPSNINSQIYIYKSKLKQPEMYFSSEYDEKLFSLFVYDTNEKIDTEYYFESGKGIVVKPMAPLSPNLYCMKYGQPITDSSPKWCFFVEG